MPTFVLDPPPVQLEELIEQRRRIGADRHDEVWEGVYHMVPGPGFAHSSIQAQLVVLLAPLARHAGLTVTVEFNLGDEGNFRIPDLGVHRKSDAHGTWNATAAIVVEVLSPGDETWQKLPFYAAHDVDELLIVGPEARSVTWYSLHGEEYRQIQRSEVVDVGAEDLAASIDWPELD